MFRIIQRSKQLIRTFSIKKKPVTYPYLFGGLLSNDFIRNPSPLILSLSGDKLKNNFCFAYKSYLQGLKDKDKQFITSIACRQLTKNLQFENVQLLHSDDNIKCFLGTQSIVFGGKFQRNYEDFKWREYGDSAGVDFFKIYTGDFKKNQTLLYSVHVYFQSSMKLIRQDLNNQKDQYRQETHMVQFEIERKNYKASEVYTIFAKAFFKKLFLRDHNAYLEAFENIFNFENCQWRIADVDRLLKGNFPKREIHT